MREGIATGAPSRIPAGATPQGDGILLGSGAVAVDVYVDFHCPVCKRFEERTADRIGRLLRDGAIRLVYHPVAFLDRRSTTAYSSRAAAASGCASDSRRFAAYKDALFVNQPPEGSRGLGDHELIELGRMVGLVVPASGPCITRETYRPWAAFVTEAAVERGVRGTPSVLVAGLPVAADPTSIAAAVADLAATAGQRDRVRVSAGRRSRRRNPGES